MRVALPTYADHPDWEVDDHPLHAALEARGAQVEQPIWNDATVDWSRFDGVLLRTTWDYFDHQPAFVAWARRVAERVPLFNPADVVRWNTEKTYLRHLADHGVPTIPTVWLDGSDLAAAANQDGVLEGILNAHGWERAFFKPVVGATAVHTLRFHRDEAPRARDFLSPLAQAGRAMQLQPYLDTVERQGEVSVVVLDGQATHGVRKVPVPGDYRVQDDHGASDEPWQPPEAVVADSLHAVAVAEAVVGPLLFARADWILDGTGQHLMCELELVEPSLFFRHAPHAANVLAEGFLGRLSGRGADAPHAG